MDPIRVAIADDEKPARKRLQELIEPESDLEVVALCTNGQEVIQTIQDHAIDLIFLDVQMPEVDGFEVLRRVGIGRMPITIFVTAYSQYALRAFDAHAIDYLLKPFSDERFEVALERAKRFLQAGKPDAILDQMQAFLEHLQPGGGVNPPANTGERSHLDRIVLKSQDRIFFLKTEEIIWIEAAGVYVKLHTQSESYLHRELLGNLEQRLNPAQFTRIHRSAIVNIDSIKELLPDSHGEYEIVLKNSTHLRLSRTYRPKLQARLGQQL